MNIHTFIFNPFRENTYIVSDATGEAVIIDAGCLSNSEKQAVKHYIEKNKLNLKHLLNTHLHIDHQFGNRFIHETYHLSPEACKEDEFFIDTMLENARLFGIDLHEEPPAIGLYIIDNQEIKFGDTTLKALHVPGHSPGSMAFYDEKDAVVFTGDVLFSGTIGATHFEKGDHDLLIRSIWEKLMVLPDETIVYSGHGQPTTIGKEKKFNPYLI
jgi:hydroxyacylglutathione hydrolase